MYMHLGLREEKYNLQAKLAAAVISPAFFEKLLFLSGCLGTSLRAVPELILGGGAQTLFCPVGGGCFVDNVSEGWGVEG